MRASRLGLCLGLASLLFSSACGVASAERVAVPVSGQQIAIAMAPAKVRAPYDVQVIRENGDVLPTHAARDRFYVQGNAGERYIIRVSNPTANRVEAVVSVDGLDVVDGEAGDLHKRGYVVPPYGDVRIEGFRTSASDVATFRFSAVSDSYAGKKGVARNVGVIAVAIFEERDQQPQIIVEQAPPHRRYEYQDDLDGGASPSASRENVIQRGLAETPTEKSAPTAPTASGAARAPARLRPTPPAPRDDRRSQIEEANDSREWGGDPARPSDPMPPVTRPGLGTEFGEQRYSAASTTRFVRADGRPIAIAELRYNDVPGLAALGINVQPLPDANEIMTRETADPFPGDGRFAAPPPRR